jgi:uncharacterized protein
VLPRESGQKLAICLLGRYRERINLMPVFIEDVKALAMLGSLRISALYIAWIIVMAIALTALVIRQRRLKMIGIGDGGDKATARAIRVHGNFSEQAPYTLAALVLLPLLGTSVYVIHAVGALFLIGRLAHAYGLTRTGGSSVGRVAGMVMTFASHGIAIVFLLRAALSL